MYWSWLYTDHNVIKTYSAAHPDTLWKMLELITTTFYIYIDLNINFGIGEYQDLSFVYIMWLIHYSAFKCLI